MCVYIETKLRENPIKFLILCHVSYLILNFVSNELLSVKIENFKSN